MFKLCIIKARSTWVCWRTGIWRFQCAFMSYGGQCTYRKTDVLFSLFRINIGQGRIYFISCLHKNGYDMTVQPAVYLIYNRDCSLKCSVLFNKRRKCNTINHSHGFTKFKRNFNLFIHTFSKNAVSLMLNSICLILNIWIQTLHYFIFFKCQ